MATIEVNASPRHHVVPSGVRKVSRKVSPSPEKKKGSREQNHVTPCEKKSYLNRGDWI